MWCILRELDIWCVEVREIEVFELTIVRWKVPQQAPEDLAKVLLGYLGTLSKAKL